MIKPLADTVVGVPSTAKCKVCGKECRGSPQYCPYCGSSLSEGQVLYEEGWRRKRARAHGSRLRKKYGAVAAFAVFLVLVAAFVYVESIDNTCEVTVTVTNDGTTPQKVIVYVDNDSLDTWVLLYTGMSVEYTATVSMKYDTSGTVDVVVLSYPNTTYGQLSMQRTEDSLDVESGGSYSLSYSV